MRGRDRRIRYARVSDAEIAYQVSGDGPEDLLVIPGLLNHIESVATVPELGNHYGRLAQFARVVLYDKRGTGLSGPLSTRTAPTIEDRVDEAVAVLDAVGSETASVYASADGCPVAIVLAALHPERVQKLALYAASARLFEAPDYPKGWSEVVSPEEVEAWRLAWGDDDDPADLDLILPSRAHDPAVRSALASMERIAGTPSAAMHYVLIVATTDVRAVLPMVRAPTLVLHVRGDLLYPIEQGRFVARGIPDARFVEIPGDDHYFFWESAGRVEDELETFLTGRRTVPPSDRSFAIVLFTDIVESTRRLADVGDNAWRRVLERHAEVVASVIPEYGGRVVKGTGDGMLAIFDGPSRAARCACRLVESLGAAGIEIRAGLHAGEVEWLGDDVAGIAVHIAARVCAYAGAAEVLATRTLRDLTAGSDIAFHDRGEHELRGVPDRWSLQVVDA
jgi:class 3 adenylate cyclase/pimeloyl-ACP methyl ester carboxylesterase